MPRKAPSRTGQGGNRTDVGLPGLQTQGQGQPNGIPHQPIGVPTGLPYGEAGQLAQSQSQVPLPQSAPTDFASVLAAAKNQVPGKGQRGLTPLNAPTERPGEPITQGMQPPFGTGQPVQGPSPQAGVQGPISSALQSLARASGNPKIAQLAQQAQALGQ